MIIEINPVEVQDSGKKKFELTINGKKSPTVGKTGLRIKINELITTL